MVALLLLALAASASTTPTKPPEKGAVITTATGIQYFSITGTAATMASGPLVPYFYTVGHAESATNSSALPIVECAARQMDFEVMRGGVGWAKCGGRRDDI